MPHVCQIAFASVDFEFEQAKARSGKVIAVATDGDELIPSITDAVFWTPKTPWLLSPVINVIPLQLFAYHIAVLRGLDVDQPRNLAKSVTVEYGLSLFRLIVNCFPRQKIARSHNIGISVIVGGKFQVACHESSIYSEGSSLACYASRTCLELRDMNFEEKYGY